VSRAAVLLVVLASACSGPADAPDLDRARGINAVAQGRYDLARQYFMADVDAHPGRVESIRDAAVAWTQGYQRSRAEARRLFAAYLERRPDDVDARQRLIAELLAVSDLEAARTAAEDLDDSPRSCVLRARVLETLEPEAAELWVRRALEASGSRAAAWAVGARLAEARGDLELARERAELAVRSDVFDYSSAYLLTRVASGLGDERTAEWALEVHRLGSTLLADGTRPQPDPADEVRLLEELGALTETPSQGFRLRKVQALLRVGRVLEAEPIARELAADPELSLTDLLGMATAADGAGARTLSRSLFEEAFARDPEAPGAVASLALLAWQAGETERARDLIDGGLRSRPHFARYHYLRGLVVRTAGDPNTAVEAFRDAVRLAPWEWRWRADLALTLQATGRTAEARAEVAAAPERPPGWTAWLEEHPQLVEE
jgi:tetratricopeptide (TPR) repeat protein